MPRGFSQPGTLSRRTYKRNSLSARAARVQKARNTNIPVRRIQRRKYVPKVKKNTQSIYTLARQVRTLQNRSWGNRQLQHQWIMLNNDSTRPGILNPVCFALNNFYSGAEVWRGEVNSGKMATYATVANWTKQTATADILSQYNWMQHLNEDTVSPVGYKALTSKLNFIFTGDYASNVGEETSRWRITFFKMKKIYLNTDARSYSVPGSLGAYWRLCNDNPDSRNHFSPIFHKILADKWITFKKPEASTMAVHKPIYKKVVMPFAFKGHSSIIKTDKTADPINQGFLSNIPQEDKIYCLISCSNTNSPGINLRVERTNVWRDHHGVMG